MTRVFKVDQMVASAAGLIVGGAIGDILLTHSFDQFAMFTLGVLSMAAASLWWSK